MRRQCNQVARAPHPRSWAIYWPYCPTSTVRANREQHRPTESTNAEDTDADSLLRASKLGGSAIPCALVQERTEGENRGKGGGGKEGKLERPDVHIKLEPGMGYLTLISNDTSFAVLADRRFASRDGRGQRSFQRNTSPRMHPSSTSSDVGQNGGWLCIW